MKKTIFLFLVFALPISVFAAKTVNWNDFEAVQILQMVEKVDYGAGLKTTEIIAVTVRATSDTGAVKRYTKYWDMRPDNPSGFPQLPAQCRTAARHQCDEWLYQQTALEAINETKVINLFD